MVNELSAQMQFLDAIRECLGLDKLSDCANDSNSRTKLRNYAKKKQLDGMDLRSIGRSGDRNLGRTSGEKGTNSED